MTLVIFTISFSVLINMAYVAVGVMLCDYSFFISILLTKFFLDIKLGLFYEVFHIYKTTLCVL